MPTALWWSSFQSIDWCSWLKPAPPSVFVLNVFLFQGKPQKKKNLNLWKWLRATETSSPHASIDQLLEILEKKVHFRCSHFVWLTFSAVACQHGATLEMSWRARARWRRPNRRTETPSITAATWPTCCITCELVSLLFSHYCVVIYISVILHAHALLPLWTSRCAFQSTRFSLCLGCSDDLRVCMRTKRHVLMSIVCVHWSARLSRRRCRLVLFSPEGCRSDRVINDAVVARGGNAKHPQPTRNVCSNVCGLLRSKSSSSRASAALVPVSSSQRPLNFKASPLSLKL